MKRPKASALRTTLIEIEAAGGARRGGKGPRRHRQRQRADRDIDKKQPMPRGDRKDRRSHARACGAGHCDHHRHVADPLAEPRVRIDEPDERDVDAHDPGRAQPLDQTREGQHGECRRERAGEGGGGEDGEPPPVDAPIAEHVAERRERQQRDGDGELEGVDDPDSVLRRDGELSRHRRQRNRYDIAVEHRHGERHGQGRECQQALRIVEAVVGLAGRSGGYRLGAVQSGEASLRLTSPAIMPPSPTSRRRRSGRS